MGPELETNAFRRADIVPVKRPYGSEGSSDCEDNNKRSRSGSVSPTSSESESEASAASQLLHEDSLLCVESAALECEEQLFASPCTEPNRQYRSTFPSFFSTAAPCPAAPSFSDISKPELCLMLRNQLIAEPSLRSFNMGASPLTYASRRIVIGWLVEVCSELNLQQDTLFLAVSLLDRFTAVSPTCLNNILQLAATACFFVAAKDWETREVSVEDCVVMADKAFHAEDLPRMEWMVLEALQWQTRAPTSYSFLQLLRHGLPPLPHSTQSLSSFLVELSLLDADMLAFSHSTTAAAALLLADIAVSGSSGCVRGGLADLLPLLDDSELCRCMAHLSGLHQQACFGGTDMTCQPILEKYRQSEVMVSLVCPVTAGQGLQTALQASRTL